MYNIGELVGMSAAGRRAVVIVRFYRERERMPRDTFRAALAAFIEGYDLAVELKSLAQLRRDVRAQEESCDTLPNVN